MKAEKFRPHGGAKRGGLTYKALRELGVTKTKAYKENRFEPREEYLARAEQRREAVLRLRREGKTIRAIAEELGVSVGTVHRHIKAAEKAA